MTSLGWFLMAVGLAVWAVGAHEFVTSELVEFLRGGPPEGGPHEGGGPGPPDDQVDQLRQPSEHQSR